MSRTVLKTINQILYGDNSIAFEWSKNLIISFRESN